MEAAQEQGMSPYMASTVPLTEGSTVVQLFTRISSDNGGSEVCKTVPTAKGFIVLAKGSAGEMKVYCITN
jgi:hypothetical protein